MIALKVVWPHKWHGFVPTKLWLPDLLKQRREQGYYLAVPATGESSGRCNGLDLSLGWCISCLGACGSSCAVINLFRLLRGIVGYAAIGTSITLNLVFYFCSFSGGTKMYLSLFPTCFMWTWHGHLCFSQSLLLSVSKRKPQILAMLALVISCAPFQATLSIFMFLTDPSSFIYFSVSSFQIHENKNDLVFLEDVDEKLRSLQPETALLPKWLKLTFTHPNTDCGIMLYFRNW